MSILSLKSCNHSITSKYGADGYLLVNWYDVVVNCNYVPDSLQCDQFEENQYQYQGRTLLSNNTMPLPKTGSITIIEFELITDVVDQ